MEIDSNLVFTLVMFVLGAALMGLLAWLTTRNANSALLAVLDRMLADKTGQDAVEGMLKDLDPQARAALLSVLDWFEGIADGTPTALDDKLIDLLKKVSDGLPNVRAA